MQISETDRNNARSVYVLLLLSPICGFGFGLAPAIMVVIIWAFSNNLFLKVHAQQGLILVFCAGIFILLPNFGILPYGFSALGISVWLLGNIAGIMQANRGRSWIGNFRAEIIKRPMRSVQAAKPTTPQPGGSLKPETSQKLLDIFRNGPDSERQLALRSLEELGQVEEF